MILHRYCSLTSEQKKKDNAQARNVDPSNGMQHWFLLFQEVLQSGQHICQRQGNAFFSKHLKKIQVKNDNNDLSIGKKFDKSSESERKEAYEKASLEHEQ